MGRRGTGLRQRYVVVAALLSAATFPSVVWRGIERLPRRVLPPRALVVGLSPLNDVRAIRAFADMRERGLDVAVVEVAPPASPGSPFERRRQGSLTSSGSSNGP